MRRQKNRPRSRETYAHRMARRATANPRVARRVRHASKPKIIEVDARDVHPEHVH